MTGPLAGDVLDGLRSAGSLPDEFADALFRHLVAAFSPAELAPAVKDRLHDLSLAHGRLLLRLVEHLRRDDLFDSLATSLEDQPDLEPAIAMDAFAVLAGTGRVEAVSSLSDRRRDLESSLNIGNPMGDLLMDLSDDPEAIASAVEALSRIEPAIRDDIVADLDAHRSEPAIGRFLSAWAEKFGPSPPVDASQALAMPTPTRPRLVGCVFDPPDGEGRGTIDLIAEIGPFRSLARFEGDVMRGLVGFASGEARDPHPGPIPSEGAIGGAIVLIESLSRLGVLDGADGASSWLSSLGERPARSTSIVSWRGAENPPVDWRDRPLPEACEAILDACPDWRLRSPRVDALASELSFRDGPIRPDPARDPGPFRVLFETLGPETIERYRRMLVWSASSWSCSGRDDLATGAMRIASELDDPQNAVPGHPFFASLMARSLEAAIREVGDR